MKSAELIQLQEHLGLTLKVMEINWDEYKESYGFTYDNEGDEAADRMYFNWHHFRGVHDPQSCMLDEEGHVRGIILRGTVTAASLELPELPALEYVCVCDNEKLTTFRMPGVFPLLQHLELSNNNLTAFELTQPQPLLKNFNIRKNQLTTLGLPAELPALEALDVTDNALTSLALRGQLPALKYLELSNNQLESIESQSFFNQLRKLNLKGNKLKQLPKGQYDRLETLYVSDNPLENYEESLIKGNDKGGNAAEIIAQLRAIAASGERPNERVKLIVVGNGRVGKTSLVKRLSKLAFDPEEIYTHGVAITELQKEHFPDVKTERLQLNVWDFGGQEVFYATHQFFMSEEAAYLYVWTDERLAKRNKEKDKIISPADERWRPHQYWLDNVRMHGKESPVVVVKTHAMDALESFPDGLVDDYDIKDDILNFDAEEERTRRLDEIRRVLTTRINDLPLLGKPQPVSFYRLINRIAELRQNKQYELTKDAFTVLAQEVGIGEGDVNAALSYLHKTGEVIFLEDKEVLKNKIFIDPIALTRRVYQLIDSNDELIKREGQFDAAYAEKLLGDDWQELLALLEGFELIFCSKSREPAVYIAPQYLPRLSDRSRNEQNSFNHHKKSNPIKFSLRYPKFMPDNVMVNLLSKYGPSAEDAVYRDNILFTDEATSERCLIHADEVARTIDVHVGDGRAANILAKDVYESLIKLSKKAEVYVASTPGQWVKRSVLSENNSGTFPLADGSGITPAHGFGFLWKTGDEVGPISRAGRTFPRPEPGKTEFEVSMAPDSKIRLRAIAEINPLHILFLAATPRSTGQINTGLETRFKDLIREFDRDNKIKFTEEHGLSQERFRNYLFTQDPHIVHFAGHGDMEELILEDKPLAGDVLLGLIKGQENTQILLLNACNTLPIAREIAAYVPYVIATQGLLPDDVAIIFARGFYTGIAAGRSVEDSFRYALIGLQSEGYHNHNYPVLVKRTNSSSNEASSRPDSLPAGTSIKGTGSNDISPPKKIFLSYARSLLNDAKELKTHLAVQVRNKKIDFWYDQEIVPGEDWNSVIEEKIQTADIFILLLNADFWASDFIQDKELPLIEQRKKEGSKVLCVMVSANDFEDTKWSKLQSSPRRDGRLTSVEEWDKPSKAWQAVVDDLKKMIQ